MTERQEAAAKLRELRHRTYYREEIVEDICDAISIADPVNTFREPEDVYELLADLIDPTCHMKPNYVSPFDDPQWFTCDKCGNDAEQLENYCPHCGARVVNEDE
ncbi:MAG: hypothetical protein K6F24_05330 [Atopobiaceae bacterium]|nr:hypothetical protein [Atopobiaceae bacterium]